MSDIVYEVNLVRSNPKKYSEKIRNLIPCFKGKILRLPGSKSGIITTEGAAAYKECAEFLENHEPVETLKELNSLNKIAKDFLERLQATDPNDIGAIDMEDIISRYGNFVGSFSRAIDFGGENPEDSIINLLVCDGDSARGQRDSMFNQDLHYVGTATGKHKIYQFVTVIISCTKFTSNNSNDDIEVEEKLKSKPNTQANKAMQQYNEPVKESKLEKGKCPITYTNSYYCNDTGISQPDEEDMIIPVGVKSINRDEKIITEGGKRKKVIKIVKHLQDGSIETEINKEVLE